ncbi:aldo/keto reductase [Enterococcus xiangfangensis]|uniref:Aldo/keto reductase n=1 Tax=Enterococcus xiangfangensis TaxID=1296537 RepID=A0ABU3F9L2_9ENTE|nr:aldo/keto reductase [Enterococcus xiangfangensis]MDT2759175.1 aldo/keto reductase [Enterococcus xiangfangensis]
MYKALENRYEQTKIRHAGNSGLMLPAISLGLWRHYGSNAPLNERSDVILHAFDQGIFHFDVANNYGNDGSEFGSTENLFGQILSQELKAYRNELVISTKAGYEIHDGPYGIGTSRKSLFQGINDSLKRLQLDYVDIYYAHCFDEATPIEETVRALDDIVRQGKALYVGISNYQTPQAKEAVQLFKDLGTPFVLDQMSMNMLNAQVDDSGLTDLLQASGAALIAYGPLAEGLLSDRYLDGIPDNFRIHHTNSELLANGEAALVKRLKALNEIALERNQTLNQMALAWLLRNPVVASVIIGTTSIEHLDDNLKALDHLDFSAEEAAKINELLA